MNVPNIQTETVSCHAIPQETIIDFANKVFQLAQTGKTVRAKFNKIEFLVAPDSFQSPKEIANYYLSENHKQYEEYKATPDYKEKAEAFKLQLENDKKRALEQEKLLLGLRFDDA